ncbi:MAG: DMT family transporter [Micavibrio sp.]|nr:DMT family transporter [Micavibrio sp.]
MINPPENQTTPTPLQAQVEKHWLVPTVGALLVWGFWAFLPKMALQSMQPHSVIMYESLGNMLVALPILVHQRFRLQVNKRGIFIVGITSVLTVFAILSYFYALRHGTVSVVVTLTAMYPVIALVLAGVVLKERLNRIQYFAVFLAMVAILLLAIP